jgi:membrane-bound lytic murein transglycosylase A
MADPQGAPRLEPLEFADLPGFVDDDLREAFAAFRVSAEALCAGQAALRVGLPASEALLQAAGAALTQSGVSPEAARDFFTAHFRPHRILAGAAFFTGYFEPVVEGSVARSAEFTAPILSRPPDLVTLPAEAPLASPDGPLQSALRGPDGGLGPCPDRAAIEAGALAGSATPVVWLRDPVEVFIIQVQGSARVRLQDGSAMRLTYAGRNGWPYTSIGRILVEERHIPAEQMSLAGLKEWIRQNGQEPGQPGRALMQRNRSYVFFQAEPAGPDGLGPTGAQGVALSPLRSIAVDRGLWAYGLPFWIDADLPWHEPTPTPFRRLMIAQDTGSAIVGPKRADIYLGSGEQAGRIAGGFRHNGEMVVLLPIGDAP